MSEPKTYTGLTLLNKILEMSELTSKPELWTLEAQKDNEPRFLRLKQIHSLIDAFFPVNTPNGFIEKAKELFSEPKRETIHTVYSGEFIKNQSAKDYTELIELMKSTIRSEGKPEGVHLPHLQWLYEELINYKKRLRKLMTFNEGFSEVNSIIPKFSIYLTSSISSQLKGKTSQLDNVLELLINPHKLSFTESELIEKYDYFPEDELNRIDWDYL